MVRVKSSLEVLTNMIETVSRIKPDGADQADVCIDGDVLQVPLILRSLSGHLALEGAWPTSRMCNYMPIIRNKTF